MRRNGAQDYRVYVHALGKQETKTTMLLDSTAIIVLCNDTANSNTMGPYSTHMDAEFDAGFIVK